MTGLPDSENLRLGKAPKSKASKKKTRVGHQNPGSRPPAGDGGDPGDLPRGWIQPDGRFVATTQHWQAVAAELGDDVGDDPAEGEKSAHRAYSLGWISLGHGGAINAIGHKSTFDRATHPAVVALRKLVARVPHFALRIEKQLGQLDPATGKHEDFDVREYDLDYFVRRGRLRPT